MGILDIINAGAQAIPGVAGTEALLKLLNPNLGGQAPKAATKTTPASSPNFDIQNSMFGGPVASQTPNNGQAALNLAPNPPDVPSNPAWQGYSGPSGDDMAKKEYAAQYALLDKMRGDTTTSYNNAGNQMGSIYEALSKAMSGQTAGIKSDYAAQNQSIGDNYNTAIAGSNAGYDKSRSNLQQMAEKLGIQQGIPGAEQSGMDQQNFLTGLMNANKTNDMNSNQRQGQNQVDYNTRNAQIENNMGAQSRQDFKQRLITALSGIDDKQMGVTANQAASANKYNMDIANMNSTSQSAWNTDQTNKGDALVKQGTLALAQQKQAFDEANTGANTTKPTAYDTLDKNAQQMYAGLGGTVAAKQAYDVISSTFVNGSAGNSDWLSASDFMRDVIANNPNVGNKAQLAQLAGMFYTQMANEGAGKSISGGAVVTP